MNRLCAALALFSLVFLMTPAFSQTGGPKPGFVTRSGDRLLLGGEEFRFVSVNIPNLHYIEDNLPFDGTNPWRFPDEFEIRDALTSTRQMGGRVVRTYTLSVRKADDQPSVPRHVLAPGEFNEEAFVVLDKIMQLAGEMGIKVIIPFVDQWPWFGGIAQYSAFRGKKEQEFWTDPQVIADLKLTINYLVNRKNTCTGILYRDDPALLAWETGNELYSPASWSREIAAYIKSIDTNHLVLDGYHAGSRGLQPDVLNDPNVDMVTTHHYPETGVSIEKTLRAIRTGRQLTAGKKAYFVGEFGFIPIAEAEKVVDTVIENQLSGVLIWSLRFHNRDGGFYWHTEPFGAGLYKAYHWPGFPTGEAYEEAAVLALLRNKAYAITGSMPPPIEVPQAPNLLPITSVHAISWQGSAGASGYDVQRATRKAGPWTVVGSNVDDTASQYRPLFSDPYAEPGASYFYRVIARNAAGTSPASNVVGPVRVTSLVLVDEMADFSKMLGREGALLAVSNETRKSKEDISRIKGKAGASISYRTPQPIRSVRVLAFFEGEVFDFDVMASTDGITYSSLTISREDYFGGKGDYDYWKPVSYQAYTPAGSRFLKIIYRADAQIGRVEIEQGPPASMTRSD